MTTQLPFSNNTIAVYAYEGFSYTISNPDANVYTLQTVSNSSGFGVNPSPVYFTKDGDYSYLFGVSDLSNNLTPGTQESFLLQVTGPTTLTSSNIVNINPGRFLDGSGASLSNAIYTFYKNEPITRIRLVAPSFTLKVPTSVPTLPPGISFVQVASNIYDISGIPLVTAPTSNYLIIGAQNGGSKIVTTRFNLSVSNERVQVNLSGSPIINNMVVGTPITPRVFTAIPPIGSSAVRYSFPTLPDGITATDSNGNIKTSPATITSDPSFTLILSGTPTLTAANAFRDGGATSSGVVYPFQISRTNPLPIVDASQGITFAFGETVLFDTPVLQSLYNGVSVDPSRNYFRAATYFAGTVGMSNIFSPDLRSDLSLAFIPSLSRANLFAPTGSPTSAGSATYTIRAINSNAVTRDLQQTITVSNDSVSFSSPVGVDLCYNFILSRPASQSKTGYYPGTIQFSASAVSGLPVSLSAPALNGTGLSLDSNGVVSGIPTTIASLTDLVVTATVSGSPATATKTVKFAILNDTFTFADVSASDFSFIQNRAAIPFQVQATTLSGRGITGFSQIGLPSGLTISPAGVVSGVPTTSSPTGGNATISATTGYASGSRDFSFNLIPDSILFAVPSTSYTAQAGQSIGPIDIDGIAYSGVTVSNYDLSLSPTYGMTINSSNGILSGTWSTGIPPSTLLPSSCNFFVTANVGTLKGTLSTTLTANPTVRNAMMFSPYEGSVGGSISWMYYTTPDLLAIQGPPVGTGPEVVQIPLPSIPGSTPAITQFVFKNNSVSNNTMIVPTTSSSGIIYRGTQLNNVEVISLESTPTYYPIVSSAVNKSGTSTWWLGGRRTISGVQKAVLIKSIDDGLTWDVSSSIQIKTSLAEVTLTRDGDGSNILVSTMAAPYIVGGLTLAYDSTSGVLLVGGLKSGVKTVTTLRSTDDGGTWTAPHNSMDKECAAFSVADSNVWVTVGSDIYETNDNALAYSAPTQTIKYSTDQGDSWTGATGDFNMFGYTVTYASNTWIATGTSQFTDASGSQYREELRYSTDGQAWTQFDLSTSPVVAASNNPIIAPLRTGPVVNDGNYWYVFVNQGDGTTGEPKIYKHDMSTSLLSNWTALEFLPGSGFVQNQPNFSPSARYIGFSDPRYLYTGDPPINVTLNFTTVSGTGPTFTSPISRSYIQYQYVPISPIQLSATGNGPIYFFVSSNELPPGLTFNQITNQITGSPAQAGNVTTNVYAKDSSGTSLISLNFSTLIPRIIRTQDGAGAYTSLLRQYTEVLGAQNARDNRVLPSQESRLGEFMSPEAPDVVTQRVDPRCFDPNACA